MLGKTEGRCFGTYIFRAFVPTGQLEALILELDLDPDLLCGVFEHPPKRGTGELLVDSPSLTFYYLKI